jgi:Straboviridae polynucleotide kinase
MLNCIKRQDILAMRGVPGSGKSTWANAWVAGGSRRARVNRDDIRKQLFNSYFGPEVDEKVVGQVQTAMIKSLLSDGYSVIVDNTHISLKPLRQLADMAGNTKRFSVVQIDVPLEVALARNASRDRFVPEEVIVKMYNQLNSSPLPDEWMF